MAEPILEILEYQAEKDIEKKRKPSIAGPVSIEELTKNMPEIEVKKPPVSKPK